MKKQFVDFLFSVYETVFGCSHRRWGNPFTPMLEATEVEYSVRKTTGRVKRIRVSGNPYRTYRVCLDCGETRFYDLKEMRFISRKELNKLFSPLEEEKEVGTNA